MMFFVNFWKKWVLFYLLPPLFFVILISRWDIGTIYHIDDTGLLMLEFYQAHNYVPVVYRQEDSEWKKIESIDLGQIELGSIFDIGRHIIKYEVCFRNKTAIQGKDRVPPEKEFPFKDAELVSMLVGIGEQNEKASVSLDDKTGRQGVTVMDGRCEDIPSKIIASTGDISITYNRSHLFHRDFFDQMKNQDAIVSYNSDNPKFGRRYAGAITEEVTLIIKPKSLWLWRLILLGAFFSVWVGFMALLKGSFLKK